MIVPFFALAALIAFVPAFGMVDRLQVIGAASTILSLALAVAAFIMPASSLSRFRRLMQPLFVAILAAPALWMVVQILPMPLHGGANQIWSSASSALNQSFAGAVSIDIGATLLSLAQYCAVVAAAFVTAIVAQDRQRAEHILYILMGVTTVVAAWQVVNELGAFDRSTAGNPANNDRDIFFAVTGTLVSFAAAIHVYDRQQRSGGLWRAGMTTILLLSTAVLAFFTCSVAVLIHGDIGVIIASLVGAGMLGGVLLVRQLSPGAWGKAGLAAAAAIALFGALATIPAKKDTDLAIAWSIHSQSTAERMLVDVPFAGSGAGTYQALATIYRDVAASTAERPTAAAIIIIEMGRTFFAALFAAVIFGASLLFRRALERRKDYIFVGAGAAMLATGSLLVLVGGGMFGPDVSLLAGVLGGLAFAQSLSAAPRLIAPPFALQAPLSKGAGGQAGEPLADELNVSGKRLPRFALAVLGLVLIMQAAWILGAEYYARGQGSLAYDAAALSIARDRIQKAAAIAVVRGDLWAESARVQIALLEAYTAAGLNSGLAPALEDLNRAVRYAPHRSDAWLMLALLADRYKPTGYDAVALLKMSYYTAPNDLALLPLRLNVALTGELTAEDAELQDMIKGDIRRVLTRQPALRPALAAAYRAASPARKLTAERLISEVDSGYLRTILSR